jgi:hypothetical protein
VHARVVFDAIVSTKTFRNATKSKIIISIALGIVRDEENGIFKSSEMNIRERSNLRNGRNGKGRRRVLGNSSWGFPDGLGAGYEFVLSSISFSLTRRAGLHPWYS